MRRNILHRIITPSAIIIFVLCTIVVVQYFTSLKCLSKENNKANKEWFRIIAIILSSPDNVKQRNTIRQTWLANAEVNVKYLFPIGTKDIPSDQRLTLKSENQMYNDLLFLPHLLDSYHTITEKVLHAIVFVIDNYKFDFMLKCDDDSYVLIDKILMEINKWQHQRKRKELYWGFFNGNARVKKSGPWKETDWVLCDHYIPYALGGGYLLSYNLVKFIATNHRELKLYNSEDVSIGVWLAPFANIERKHDIRFNTEYISRGCSNQYIITHKQSIGDLRILHERYMTTGNLCDTEVIDRPGYQYNWSVPPSQCCERLDGII